MVVFLCLEEIRIQEKREWRVLTMWIRRTGPLLLGIVRRLWRLFETKRGDFHLRPFSLFSRTWVGFFFHGLFVCRWVNEKGETMFLAQYLEHERNKENGVSGEFSCGIYIIFPGHFFFL